MKMNWHQTIEYIRKKPEYAQLVEFAYFDENLELNIERFSKSDEFQETLNLIRQLCPEAKSILEIGAGNGIAAINFAKLGYNVTAVEPDNSETIGAGAIRKLIEQQGLKNCNVYECYAEEIGLADESFDIVYIRQAMHHAYDLKKFIQESARVLKKGGFLFTIRDHVVFDDRDKELFLEMHPLHKYYGGENAFHPEEYKQAIQTAGLTVVKELKYFDSVINYYPIRKDGLQEQIKNEEEKIKNALKQKISFLAEIPFVFWLYKKKNGLTKNDSYLNEARIPGRMYSYIAKKV